MESKSKKLLNGIFFAIYFIISVTVALNFYFKFEDLQIQNDESKTIINEININSGGGSGGDTNLVEDAQALVDEYKNLEEDNKNYADQVDALEDRVNELTQYNAELIEENADLQSKYDAAVTKLINSGVVEGEAGIFEVEPTSKRLRDLYLIESSWYELRDVTEDAYGNSHDISYHFNPNDIASAKYKLDGLYDVFSANIVPAKEMSTDARLTAQILVGGDLVKTVPNITRDEPYYSTGPIPISGAFDIEIKIAKIEGGRNSGQCYITEDTLSVASR